MASFSSDAKELQEFKQQVYLAFLVLFFSSEHALTIRAT